MQEAEIEALLKHLGFTEYEAKAYLTLIIYGTLNAEKISRVGNIPLPRVYDTMGGLADRGLVFVSKTRPQEFKVVNPKQLLSLLKEDEKKKMEKKIEKIETIMPQLLRSIPAKPIKGEVESEEVIATVKRKLNMEKLWFDFLSETKYEILVFAGDLSWVEKTSTIIKKSIKRGVKYKILWCRTGKKIISRVKKLMKMDIELRYVDTGDIRGVILDNKKISLVQKIDSERDLTTIIITNRLITNIFRRYFMHLWDKGMPLKKFLKKS
ncbi:MAG: hypothetical protein GTN40_05415 [Candidatus Aenigmarchaeota archaeon]|nr:hypothetical protein [Candidatus Aenigmarchaeota archaeon]